MNTLFLLIWIALLLIFTLTADFKGMLREQEFIFDLKRSPDFSGFMNMYTVDHLTSSFILQKIGHFFFFFVLALLALKVFKRLWMTVLLGLVLAVGTELLQAFFLRGARLFDVFINLAGTMSFVLLFLLIKQFVIEESRKSRVSRGKRSVS